MKQTIGILVVAILFSTAVTASPKSLFSFKVNYVDNPVKPQLAIVPNIKTGAVKISFKAEKAMSGTVLVKDQNGNTVLKQPATILAGNNTILVNNFINLDEGTYLVYVKAGKKIYQSTYLLWK